MTEHYPDGAELPYRVMYSTSGGFKSVRFSDPTDADQEVLKLLRRGHVVNLDVWDLAKHMYITRYRYS